MKAKRCIHFIAAILIAHSANAQHILTLQCMEMESLLISPSCPGFCDGSIDLLVTGGQPPYSYLWNTTDSTEDLFNLCAGEYMVTVSDANGCTVDSSYIIIDPVPFDIVATGTAVSCDGLCDGSFDPDNFGGPWENYTLNYPVDLSALCAGEYVDVLTAYDANGCTTVFTVNINSPEPLEADVFVTPASCVGSCDGQIEIDVSGGTPPYSYSNFNGMCDGPYVIFVMDANGCLLEIDVFVSYLSDGPTINDIVVTDENTGQADGSLTILASGTCPPFIYSLNNGPFQASNIFTGLPAGVYLVSVKDGCGCITETEVLISNLTSVNELKANLSLYPNPVDTYLQLESDLPCSIELIDINGQMVRHSDKAKSHYLNVEDMIPGIYLLRISDGLGAAYRKVIVQ